MTTSLPVTTQFNSLPTESYDALLTEKITRLNQLLAPFVPNKLELQVFESPKEHFRMRAEFGIWHEGDDCFYTMTEKDAEGNSQKVKVTTFPIASKAINDLMQPLLAYIKSEQTLKHKLFQIEFLNTLAGDMLVTLIYHKKLDDDWLQHGQALEKKFSIKVIGRSRKQKEVLSEDFVLETLQVLDKSYCYKQLEGGFTQPNAQVCTHMLTWACTQAKQLSPEQDLLELYCGNANFTLPLSRYFKQTLATEISKTSVAAAQWNIAENNINTIKIARLSAEEFTEAQQAKREFRRLKQAGITLADYHFSTVFVDPPRAGIDAETLKLLATFDNIIYISCNPDTLADNLASLCTTHQVVATALFDQFPYTHHIEAGVVLKKSGVF